MANKFITFLALLFICRLAQSFHVRNYHENWLPDLKKTATKGVAYLDVAWNYCDMKCVYLETLAPSTDFFVLTFETSLGDFKKISACYSRVSGG